MELACPACHEPVENVGKLLRCQACKRYYLNDPLPRMLTEEYAQLINRAALQANVDELDDPAELDAFLDSLGTFDTEAARWGIEDVEYWDREYEDAAKQGEAMARIQRSRPDAGLRTRPREQHIFRHLRPHLEGGVLLDVGCGHAQTVQVLCNPKTVGYMYVGVDLSLSAVIANQETMQGHFVQASATALPFRPRTFDAILMLGTLHHCHSPRETLARILDLLKRGGLIALHEVTYGRRHHSGESLHNDFVPLPEILEVVEAECDLVDLKREATVVLHVLGGMLGEPMRTRPRLTRGVLALDNAGSPLERIHPALGPRAVLLTARKR
jgi:SAM-dependent methyltransferase/uncharacterized protein YbaR (Trm112 family)